MTYVCVRVACAMQLVISAGIWKRVRAQCVSSRDVSMVLWGWIVVTRGVWEEVDLSWRLLWLLCGRLVASLHSWRLIDRSPLYPQMCAEMRSSHSHKSHTLTSHPHHDQYLHKMVRWIELILLPLETDIPWICVGGVTPIESCGVHTIPAPFRSHR